MNRRLICSAPQTSVRTRRIVMPRARNHSQARCRKPAAVVALITQDLGVGQAAVVVDGDVHEVPAQAASTVLLLAAVQPPATAGRDLAELLDVDVNQIAGTGMFVTDLAVPAAPDQLAGQPVQISQMRQLLAAQHRADRAGRHPEQR
jgi:hypothetical protein